MAKKKAQYPEDFKIMFGVSTMGMIETFGLPAFFALLALAVIYFYPLLKPSQRDAMYAEIEKVKHEHEVNEPGDAPAPVSAD